MDGVEDGAAAFVRGSFTLFVGNIVSLVMMAAGSILVARMLSPADYGLYGISIVLPELFLLFSGWGIDPALTRFLARFRADGKHDKIRILERVALLFKLCVGGVLSLVLFLSADFLAAVLLRRPGAGGFVRLASLLVLFKSLQSSVVAGLAGLERMDLRAIVSIVQAVIKGVSSPILVYWGFGVSGPVIGHLSSYVMASLLGVLFMVSSSKGERMVDEATTTIIDVLGLMLGFGMPLFIGGLVSGFSTRLQGFLLSWFVSNRDFGNYRVALNFTQPLSFVTASIVVTLFPAFSKLSYVLEPEKTREAFNNSVRYSSMFIIPIICALAAVSEPLVHFLYGTKYPQAPILLTSFLVPKLLVGVGFLSLRSFLNGQGDTGTSFRAGLVESVVIILVSPFLIGVWGALGLAMSLIVSRVTGSVFGLYVLHKKYCLYPNLWHSLRTLLGSLVSTGLSFGVIRLLSDLPTILSLFLGTGVFLTTYLFIAPVIGAIEEGDIMNLNGMLRGLFVIYPFIRIILGIERSIIRRVHSLHSR